MSGFGPSSSPQASLDESVWFGCDVFEVFVFELGVVVVVVVVAVANEDVGIDVVV